MSLDIYVFPSVNRANIRIGVQHKMWAIPRPAELRMKRQFTTKALNMPIGAHGLFYCTAAKAFTVPFSVASRPDTNHIVNNVWDGEFILPFHIHPLSDAWPWIDKDTIDDVLPTLRHSKEGWYKRIKFRPNQIFSPTTLSLHDWYALVKCLATIDRSPVPS